MVFFIVFYCTVLNLLLSCSMDILSKVGGSSMDILSQEGGSSMILSAK